MLGRENLPDRLLVVSIGAEPVDGFCRERDEAATLQDLDRAGNTRFFFLCQDHFASLAGHPQTGSGSLRIRATFFALSSASSGVFPRHVTCPILRPCLTSDFP